MTIKNGFLLPIGMLVAGCSFIPDYSQPDFSAAVQWHNMPGYIQPAEQQDMAQMSWQNFFQSPALQQVIATALENNKDLRLAALNVAEARALYRIDRADLFPTISADADATVIKISDESSITGRSETQETYTTEIGLASYEVDLFGKIRSNNTAAINSYLSTKAARHVVRNAVIAETAQAYLQLLADQKLLDLTLKTLSAQQETLNILQKSKKNGVGTDLDIARAETAVETAQVNLHQYKRFVQIDKNALTLLMGVAQDESKIPAMTLDDVDIVKNLDAGVPSEILLMRPDIRQAEYDLLARNADIGAARAAFFPSITLTGGAGFASASLGQLFSSGAAGAWSFIPRVTLPLFNAGRNRAQLDVAEIRKDKAVVEYEQAIQVAFREVSDALAARATFVDQLQAQSRLVAAGQKAYDISYARHKAGIDNFLSVLDAQRELYTFEQDQIRIELQMLSNHVELYKTLGGGFVAETAKSQSDMSSPKNVTTE